MARPILVGYDPRTRDRAPVSLGVTMARLTEAPLVVASVQKGHGPHAIALSHEQVLPFAIVQPDDDLIHDCAPQIDEIRTELEPYGIDADCVTLIGTSAASALHDAAEEHGAGLLVVGSSKRAHGGRVLAGSTAARLLSGAPCPVAVASGGWSREELPKTIGAAFRDTEDGREALRAALMLARRAHARLRVVTVVEEGLRAALQAEPSYSEGRRGTTLEDVIGEYELFARRSAEKALAELEGHDEVESEVESWVGEPAHLLIEFSKRLDLLVCGSRGYGPLRSVLLGGVSSLVVAAAQCPITVVPRGRESRFELLLAEAPGVAARA